jgi:hypothetical protein
MPVTDIELHSSSGAVNARPSSGFVISKRQSFFMLVAVAGHVPLLFWANNLTEMARPWVPVAIYLGLGVLTWLVVNFLFERWVTLATFLGMVGLLLATAGGDLFRRFQVWGFVLVSLVLVAAIVRLASTRILYLVMSTLAIYAVISPLGIALLERSRWGESNVEIEGDSFTNTSFESSEDFFLIILDAYGGRRALENAFGFTNEQFTTQLDERGFSLPEAWASYPLTHYSIPSMLEMGYLAEAGTHTSPAAASELHRIIGGSNRFISVLKASGYRFTMVEAGWGGSRCGEQVDVCVSAPVYDDALSAIGSSSVMGSRLLDQYGHGFTQGSLASMEWLRQNARRLSANGTPDVVFSHLMIPHPPTFLDAACELRVSELYTSPLLMQVSDSEADVHQRKVAYLEQVECANRFLSDFIDLAGAHASIVIAGDHGSESQAQTFTDPSGWSDSQITERLNAFLAIRTALPCDLSSPIVLPNVLRQLVACGTRTVVDDHPDRLFTMVELDAPALIHEIATDRVASLIHGQAQPPGR